MIGRQEDDAEKAGDGLDGEATPARAREKWRLAGAGIAKAAAKTATIVSTTTAIGITYTF